MSYQSCISCGWEDGIHDCRGLTYQHPWLVIWRDAEDGPAAVGCYSRNEARKVLAQLKSGTPAYALNR